MTIGYERQELRTLALLPIHELPAYGDDYTVGCRVGKAIAETARFTPWDGPMQYVLEQTLRRR